RWFWRHLAHGLNPTWSPDGSKIAFVGRVLSQGFGTKYEVWMMNSHAGDVHKIGQFYTGHDQGGCSAGLAWCGDGTRVISGGQPGQPLASKVPPTDEAIQVEDGCGTSVSSQGSVIKGGS